MHNASTVTYYPYCYKGEELLVVKYHENVMAINFSTLYNMIDSREKYDKNNNSYCKYPEDLYVKDLINGEEVWTKINKLCTHKNEKPMRFIKTANGLSICVTEDHPIISGEKEIPASDVTTKDYETTYKVNPFTNSLNSLKKINLTKDLGYLLGIALEKGTTNSGSTFLTQHPGKVLDKILKILKDYNIPYFLNKNSNKIKILECDVEKFLYDIVKNKNKVLPFNYIDFNDEFLQGVLAGIIDACGNFSTYKKRHCIIKSKSRTLLNQLSLYTQSKNMFTEDIIPFDKNKKKLIVYSIKVNLSQNEDFSLNIGSVKINDKYIPKQKNDKKKEYNFNYGDVSIVSNEETFAERSVYDISTETGHFICNNTLVHNCYAYDLSRLATEGLFFLNNYNNEPPQHLTTFLDDVIEFVSFMSNRSSGKIVPFCFFSANQQGQ